MAQAPINQSPAQFWLVQAPASGLLGGVSAGTVAVLKSSGKPTHAVNTVDLGFSPTPGSLQAAASRIGLNLTRLLDPGGRSLTTPAISGALSQARNTGVGVIYNENTGRLAATSALAGLFGSVLGTSAAAAGGAGAGAADASTAAEGAAAGGAVGGVGAKLTNQLANGLGSPVTKGLIGLGVWADFKQRIGVWGLTAVLVVLGAVLVVLGLSRNGVKPPTGSPWR